MASARDIQRRIKGVKNTRKITRAMEMIAAAKMRKAVAAAIAMRPYAAGILGVLRSMGIATAADGGPLFAVRPVARELYVVIASNRGLCGSFNAQVVRRLRQELAAHDHACGFVTIGKKADIAVRRMGRGEIVASFPQVLADPSALAMRPIARLLMDEFAAGRVDRVTLVYTRYVSALSQTVVVRPLLPVSVEDVAAAEGELPTYGGDALYVVEPSPAEVVRTVVPRLLEMELTHAVLESNASKESAQMIAMKNATDAASDMIADLTLAYNQVRQQKITQEIAEISAGMAAVQH